MAYTKDDCIKDTLEHIYQVRKCIQSIVIDLKVRAREHDKTKLESPELEGFTEYTPKLKETTYGSDEYKENLKGLQKTLEHHYANTMHHPQSFENGINDMSLVDIIEMFCDWKAATMRHDDGDLNKSIQINKERFGMSEQLTQIFRNSVDLFD